LLDLCLYLLLAALLLAVFLPLFVCYSIVARLGSGRSRSNRSELFHISLRNRQFAAGFSFDCAFEACKHLDAFEYLTGSSLAEARQ